jgi:hypothetical protein
VKTEDEDSVEAMTAETDSCLVLLEPFSVGGDAGSSEGGTRISLRDGVVAWSTFSRSSDSCDERI